MSLKDSKTTTNGMEWNVMHGLLSRLKHDNKLREYLLVSTGCYFGLRIGDLLNLRYLDVLERDEFTLCEKKTGKYRKITINKFIKNLLIDVYKKQKKTDLNQFLFANRNGGRITVQYANCTLHDIFEKYNIKVQNGSSHCLRKTFGKRVWEMDGKSERSIIYLSEIFSHASIATTKRYIGITEKQIADVYLQL